ncbi:hypothetical protein FB451DRAFT_1452297 [Mycena latifolia]|nr:hypothetical protein FB451DRAFT_1452297 [Mycena latifolia]
MSCPFAITYTALVIVCRDLRLARCTALATQTCSHALTSPRHAAIPRASPRLASPAVEPAHSDAASAVWFPRSSRGVAVRSRLPALLSGNLRVIPSSARLVRLIAVPIALGWDVLLIHLCHVPRPWVSLLPSPLLPSAFLKATAGPNTSLGHSALHDATVTANCVRSDMLRDSGRWTFAAANATAVTNLALLRRGHDQREKITSSRSLCQPAPRHVAVARRHIARSTSLEAETLPSHLPLAPLVMVLQRPPCPRRTCRTALHTYRTTDRAYPAHPDAINGAPPPRHRAIPPASLRLARPPRPTRPSSRRSYRLPFNSTSPT